MYKKLDSNHPKEKNSTEMCDIQLMWFGNLLKGEKIGYPGLNIQLPSPKMLVMIMEETMDFRYPPPTNDVAIDGMIV